MENKSFLEDNRSFIICNISIAVIWAVVGVLYNINPEFLFYEVAFVILFTTAVLVFRYNKRKKQAEVLPADTAGDTDKYELLKEKEDFFSLWAHQIKTPIAAMNLLLQNDETDAAGCRQELFKIENYVEMALNYSRFENMSGDLELKACPLQPMVKQSVKKFSRVFIHKHLKVELDVPDITVLTDEKWFCFVLEQLLSNALKYTKEGGVRIYTETTDGELKIVISDTGIGIRSSDLPRIFEKGFTGYNGRIDKKASGLGLYLCKGVCDKLGHSIHAESEEGHGTKVFIGIPEDHGRENLTKM